LQGVPQLWKRGITLFSIFVASLVGNASASGFSQIHIFVMGELSLFLDRFVADRDCSEAASNIGIVKF